MRIVHVYDGHEQVNGDGSVSGVVWDIAARMAEEDHEIFVLERRWKGLPETAEQDGVYIERLDLRTGADEPWEDIPYDLVKSPVGMARLLIDRANFGIQAIRRLRKLDPDIIHVHTPFAPNVVATLAPGLRDRLVYTAHVGETDKRIVDPTFSPDVHLAKRAARTIALNEKMRDAFIDRGVPEEKLTVIQNGVDLDRFQNVDPELVSRVKEEYAVNGDPIVLFAGTITPRKGVTELIEAASEVCATHDGVQFVILGWTDIDPGYAEEVQEEIAASGYTDRITLTGFVPEEELPAFHGLADVFALPSYDEGSSVSVTEAIAAGLPIVATNTEGISQKVDHDVHGLLSEPGDTTTLAEHIRQLVTDEETRTRMASAVEARAQEITWGRVTQEMFDTYGEIRR